MNEMAGKSLAACYKKVIFATKKNDKRILHIANSYWRTMSVLPSKGVRRIDYAQKKDQKIR